MSRVLTLVYGVVAYVVFLAAFLLAIWFVWNLDAKAEPGAWSSSLLGSRAFLIDAGLLAAFAVQHSVMARPAFKRAWTRVVPAAIERSTFVLVSSLLLLAMVYLWAPLPGTVWDLRATALEPALQAICAAGWLTVLVSTFLIDHFELFGLRQVWVSFRGESLPQREFVTRGLYRYVRHPIMLGFLIAFWAAPHMTSGHLLFSLLTTGYILVALQLEERDLAALHPSHYPEYQRNVSMLVPLPRKSGGTATPRAAGH